MKKPEIINTRGLKGDVHLITWGRVREEGNLDIAASQIFIFSNAVSEEKLPVLTAMCSSS